MNMPWEKPQYCPHCVQSPTEPYQCTCVECVDTADGGIPWFLRRDANNRAPFMDKPVNPSGSLPMKDLSEPLPWLAMSSPRTA